MGDPACEVVDASNYDQSCQQASDCTYILSGYVCSGDCFCGNSVINASDLPRYRKDVVSSLRLAACHCPDERAPQCVDHWCTVPPPPQPDAGTLLPCQLGPDPKSGFGAYCGGCYQMPNLGGVCGAESSDQFARPHMYWCTGNVTLVGCKTDGASGTQWGVAGTGMCCP